MDEQDPEVVELEASDQSAGPVSGVTMAVPRFRSDLEALCCLTASDTPMVRVVRSSRIVTVYYGFGDASSHGFGATIGRYGLWSSADAEQSSNFRELLNLVQSVEEEAAANNLADTELWLFTDNSTAEGCFSKGSSSSQLLHELVLRLRKVEMEHSLNLHVVHVAGTQMIEQGTDGLSHGLLLEGVLSGKDMLSYINIARSAIERHPPLLDFVKSWTDHSVLCLSPSDWYDTGHGIVGGAVNTNGIWIPNHAPNGRHYLWSPPPIIADVALEEALKAIHKRTDAFHIFVIPRLVASR